MKKNIRKLKLGDLRRILKEEMNLEAEHKEKHDSVDGQIDRFFAKLEGDAVDSVNEVFDWRSATRRLLEADDEDEDDASDDQPPTPQKKTLDDIDVDEFSAGIIRLVRNFDNLIETRSTIVRRAVNFLSKTYDDNVKESFLSILRDDEGLSPDQSEREVEQDNFTAPIADRSGPST